LTVFIFLNRDFYSSFLGSSSRLKLICRPLDRSLVSEDKLSGSIILTLYTASPKPPDSEVTGLLLVLKLVRAPLVNSRN
jgi:hypothetical protein